MTRLQRVIVPSGEVTSPVAGDVVPTQLLCVCLGGPHSRNEWLLPDARQRRGRQVPGRIWVRDAEVQGVIREIGNALVAEYWIAYFDIHSNNKNRRSVERIKVFKIQVFIIIT